MMKRMLRTRAAVVLVLLLLNGILLTTWRVIDLRDRARHDALLAAQGAVPRLFTYRPNDVSHYADRALPHATGQFSTELKRLLDHEFIADARRNGTTIRTTVEGAAYVEGTPTTATVLVFANQWRTDRRAGTPTFNAIRFKLTLTDTPSGWRIAQLKAI